MTFVNELLKMISQQSVGCIGCLTRLMTFMKPAGLVSRTRMMSTLIATSGTASGDNSGASDMGGSSSASGSMLLSGHFKYTPRLPRYAYFGEKIGPAQVTRLRVAGHMFFSGNFFSTQTFFSISDVAFDQVANETLNSIYDLLQDLQDSGISQQPLTVTLQNSVMTIRFSDEVPSYIICLQKPNKQIWLTTPDGSVKMYRFSDGLWKCTMDHVTLHDMLSMEISEIVGKRVDFTQCSFGRLIPDGMTL